MVQKQEKRWLEIGRGHAGWHAAYHHCSSNGGTLEGYLEEACEGCLVHDAQNADTDKFVKHVISGPMIGFNLEPGTVDRFTLDDRKAALRMLPGLSGGFDTLAVIAQSPTYGGLDRVAIDIYENLLREIPGMKIGHVHDGKVIWENEVPK